MRHLIASLMLALSILAHGFARARNGLHHLFGGLLVLLVAIVVVPVVLIQRLWRKIVRRS